ncbi:MAG: CHAT domain-containing protein [Xenococcaceae cyanobacterium MO_188.B29]|nr:CHAT domain-containing protein [Xenococcaceae cyanobacterium MO_188.B29]
MKRFKLVKMATGLTLIVSLTLANFPLGSDRFFQKQASAENLIALDLLDLLEDMVEDSIEDSVEDLTREEKIQVFNLQSLGSGGTSQLYGNLSDDSKTSIILREGREGEKLVLDLNISQFTQCNEPKVTLLGPNNKKLFSPIDEMRWQKAITLSTDGDYRVNLTDRDNSTCDHPEDISYTLAISKPPLSVQDNPQIHSSTNELQKHLLSGNAGETIIIELTDYNFEPNISIYSRDDSNILVDRSNIVAETNNPKLIVTLPKTATYQIQVGVDWASMMRSDPLIRSGQIPKQLSFKPYTLTVTSTDPTKLNLLKTEADELFQQGLQQYYQSQFQAAKELFQQALIEYKSIQNNTGVLKTVGYLHDTDYRLGNFNYDLWTSESDFPPYYYDYMFREELEEKRHKGAWYQYIFAPGQKDHGSFHGFQQEGDIFYDDNYPKISQWFLSISSSRLWLLHKYHLKISESNQLNYRQIAAYKLYLEAFSQLYLPSIAKLTAEQALNIYREIQDLEGESATLGILGIANSYLGNNRQAIDYLQKSLSVAKESNNQQAEAGALINLGYFYHDRGDYQQAVDYLQQSLIINKAVKEEIQQRKNAIEALDKQLERWSSQDFQAEWQEEEVYSLESSNITSEKEISTRLGISYAALDNYEKAIDYFKQRLLIEQNQSESDRYTQYTLNTLSLLTYNLGIAQLKAGKLLEAQKSLFAALDLAESAQTFDETTVHILTRFALIYRFLQQIFIAQNQPDRALEISERGRTQVLEKLLGQHLNETKETQSVPLTLQDIQRIAQEHQATLVEYTVIKDSFKVLGQEQIKDSELYIWVIKPTGEIIFRRQDLKPLWQKDNTSLTNLVAASRESIGVKGRGSLFTSSEPTTAQNQATTKQKQALQKLHQILIQPIADLLPNNPNERIILIPQDSLFFTPFPVLQDAKGKYLIDQHTILNAPSIQTLDLTYKLRRRGGNQAQNVLVVGNPTMPQVPAELWEPPKPTLLPSLPAAEQEAHEVAQVLRTTALIGETATESLVKEKIEQSRLIHLATHGKYDDVYARASWIALAPTDEDDGLLKASEISNLQLNAELVVLSACDTGKGDISEDGLVGLSRAFMIAGTSSIITSLWSVPDAPTAELMTEFYRQWQQTGDKAQALRNAMLKTRQKYPAPKDWAAFILMGEAN